MHNILYNHCQKLIWEYNYVHIKIIKSHSFFPLLQKYYNIYKSKSLKGIQNFANTVGKGRKLKFIRGQIYSSKYYILCNKRHNKENIKDY
ncbi:hypothetical protein PFAG_03377 [Plasmodium falciparum Santa Lucia]|uniref:Uncharacterized protein n=4 Tax=Plasmodium falciparum TaxID=5833 RepID=A0A024W6K4_PLAFA|nr:hypothetical protein PFFVO_05712 [Plasmodium falciparum Vietnam Oak-Knoll (FVO)]ETW35801.1 hypothetical protein PFTANZ_03394 [Plasmodium falciparum Tanzania (2000708)]EUR70223.1 hypothetical protein PFBG_03451 [Plasmodium falciparum 7G8]EUT83501.1 hypothetical protein PFAG_03377 [Plasmodium falciparum Santa Lucia]